DEKQDEKTTVSKFLFLSFFFFVKKKKGGKIIKCEYFWIKRYPQKDDLASALGKLQIAQKRFPILELSDDLLKQLRRAKPPSMSKKKLVYFGVHNNQISLDHRPPHLKSCYDKPTLDIREPFHLFDQSFLGISIGEEELEKYMADNDKDYQFHMYQNTNGGAENCFHLLDQMKSV
ncbi:hypothetical protein RFI_16819, partial [Reticulomyxa filosa]